MEEEVVDPHTDHKLQHQEMLEMVVLVVAVLEEWVDLLIPLLL
tara:strand:+ start:353 stop:481 length:129 start_codon:yes stop_codon:yes gene_type:complete